jgi:hypothetical protein
MGWIWEVWGLGSPAEILTQAHDLNLHTLAIKVADGTSYWSGTHPAIQTIQAGGYPVFGWHFVYGQDPMGEAMTAIQAIHDAGLSGLIIDAEGAYEALHNAGAAAYTYMTTIRKAYPNLPIGITSFGDWNYHRGVPLSVFSQYVDVLMPQIYWQTMQWPLQTAWNTCMQSYQLFKKPIVPLGQAYGSVTPVEIQQFTQNALNAHCPGVAWYRLGDMASAITQKIGGMWWTRSPWTSVATEQVAYYLNVAGNHLPLVPTWSTELEDALRQFQAAHHLVVDGIVGSDTWHALYQVTPPASHTTPPDPFATYEKQIAALKAQMTSTQAELDRVNQILAKIKALV